MKSSLTCAALCLWALVIGPSSVEAAITAIGSTTSRPTGVPSAKAGAYELLACPRPVPFDATVSTTG